MKKFKIRLNGIGIPVYVDSLTDRMQIRVITKDGNNTFVDGIDYFKGIWLSSMNIFGWTIQELIEVHFHIYYKHTYMNIKYIYVCDDVLNDKPNTPISVNIAYTKKIKDVDFIEEE